jgi:hypothetical protein
MTTTSEFSRRGLITGTVVAAGAAALAGCAPDYLDAIAPGDIHAARVRRVPVDDPDSTRWASTPTKTVELAPQNIALPHRLRPVVEAIRVTAIHDGTVIGFRIEWDDPDVDDLTVRVDDFRDACAVLLAPGPGDESLRTMGSPHTAATLLHWKADWQRDIERGRSGLEDVYPNRSADVYPPLIHAAPDDVAIADYVEAGATEWLPGTHVGNPMSSETRATAVEKIVANGFGTSTTAATQNAGGRGIRHGDGWRVTIAKPLVAIDDGEAVVSPGGVATCAFAIWSGADGDAGGRKSPSASVYRLVIDA